MIIRDSILAISLLTAFSTASHASTLNFNCITANDISGASCEIARDQMTVVITDATDGTGDKALFTFNNIGADLEAFISEIYFIDDTLLGIASINNQAGVQFTSGANPANLPGYSASASFSVENKPGASNGIQAGESLGITFDLLDGVTFSDTKNALNTGALIIGIHAQGLGAGLDDSFGESLITTIPIPAAAWLFGSGLIGLMGFAKRKKK